MTKEIEIFANKIAYAQVDGCGIQGLGRILMQKIKKPVMIIDKFRKVISWHSPYEQNISMEEKITLPSMVKDSEEIPVSAMIVSKGKKYNFLVWPIHKEKIIGYLLILHREISDFEKNFVNVTCRAVMIEMSKKQELYDSIQEYKDDFIRDILFNNYDGLDTALRSGKLWGWDFSMPYIVMVLEMKMDKPSIDNIRPIFEEKIKSLCSGSIIGKVGSTLVVLYPVKKNIHIDWKETVRNFYDKASGQLLDFPFYIGVGKLYSTPNMLYRSYQQAKVALELRELSRLEGAAFFDELGTVRLFYNQSRQDLEEFVDEILGPIIQYDKEKDAKLLFTLWEYFRVNTNMAVATKNLYIHVNTLRYRLKKAEELLEKSFDNIETKFNVYGALKVAVMLGNI